MARPEGAAQPFAQLADGDRGRKALGIDRLSGGANRRSPPAEAISSASPRLVARIGGVILARRELFRVDEQARDHPVRCRRRFPDQRQMAVVDGAHGGHQPDREPVGVPAGDPAPDVSVACRISRPGGTSSSSARGRGGLRRAWRAWARRSSVPVRGSGAPARPRHRPPRPRREHRRARHSVGRSAA